MISSIYSIVLCVCIAFAQAASILDQTPWYSNNGRGSVVIRGRVLFNDLTTPSIPSGSKLFVELQDISIADAPARVLARTQLLNLNRFPLYYELQYTDSQQSQRMYTLMAKITDNNNQLLYINDQHIAVQLGNGNSPIVKDIPVIQVGGGGASVVPNVTDPPIRRWPELVGRTGEEAARIIRSQTGFTNIVILPENSIVTMDYRFDRVRIFVDASGNVSSVPTVG